jgi:hypothetical protein
VFPSASSSANRNRGHRWRESTGHAGAPSLYPEAFSVVIQYLVIDVGRDEKRVKVHAADHSAVEVLFDSEQGLQPGVSYFEGKTLGPHLDHLNHHSSMRTAVP